MEKMFGGMMQGFFNGMSGEDKEQMKACCEQLVAMCPGGKRKDMPAEDKQARMAKMQSCCGAKMGMMASFVPGAGAAK